MRSPPKPPDLRPISDAQIELGRQSMELAREQLGLSREQFDFFRQQSLDELDFARQQAAQLLGLQERALQSSERMNQVGERVAQAQIGLMEQARDFADRDRERWEQTFIPLQDRFIADAEAYDSEARREQEAARALSEVQRQADAQRANAEARLASMGIDPSQFRSASIANMLGAQTAAAGAMQANNARRAVEDRGRALRADAINLGMGLPAQATQAIGVSSGAGSAAVGAAGAAAGSQLSGINTAAGLGSGAASLRQGALSSMGALTGSPMQWAQMGSGNMGMAGNLFNNAGSTLTQNFSNQMSRYNAQQQALQGMMSMGAGLVGMFAEGGPVKRLHAAEGMSPVDIEFSPVQRLRPALSMGAEKEAFTAGIDDAFKADSKQMLDKSISAAKPSVLERIRGAADRFQSGVDKFNAAAVAAPEWDTSVEQILRPVALAEGGRAVGALPVKQSRDTIPAMLAEGEYVIPADVVRAVGIEKLDKMVAKYHRPGA